MPKLLKILFAISVLAILFPIILLIVLTWLLYGAVLSVLVWICWCARGRYVLLVYSDSPHWHDYIEQHFISRLPQETVILNYSQKQSWRWYAFSVRVFRYFGGDREFNPIVIVFVPLRWTRIFRFWQPFRDYKHGYTQPLEDESRRMFSYLSEHGIIVGD